MDTAAGLPQSLPRDDLGREVKLARAPQRIVVIGPGATETVFALGAGSRLVGRDSASDYPPGRFPSGVRGVAVVGDFSGPFLESTIAARPDFMIVQGETYGRARIEDWQKKCGVPVAALSATNVEGVVQGIEKIGAWLGFGSRAKAIASRIGGARNVLASFLDDPKPLAFFEVGRRPLWTAGRNTLIDDVMRHGSFWDNVAKVSGYQQYSMETLLADQPRYYIVTTSRVNAQLGRNQLRFARGSPALYAGEYERVLKELRFEPGLKNLKCVQEGRVVVVPADWVLRPGPRLAKGIRELISQHLALDAKAARK
jgi:iron complex transport system substrate-binding protein